MVKKAVGMPASSDTRAASRIVEDQMIKKSLEDKSRELSQEPWFDSLCKLEKVEPTAVLAAASARIQKLSEEDNLYRLGENYWRAKGRVSKYRSIPLASYITAALSLGILGTTIRLIVANVSPGYIIIGLYLFLLSLTFPLIVWLVRNRRFELDDAPAEYAKSTTDIDRGMRSLIEQSVREVIRLRLDRPSDNVVKIGDGANLSSRVGQDERIVTRYRPAIELHMLRSGGATVGITGERGMGKSELLRSFCDITAGRATIRRGGTISVLIAVPAAFKAAQFLALVAERLACAIPGYRTPEKRYERRKFTLAVAGFAVGLILFSLGASIFYGQLSHWKLTDHEMGSAAIAVGITLTLVSYLVVLIILGRRLTERRERREPLKRRRTGAGKPRRIKTSLRPPGSAPARRYLGRDAERLMWRLKYAETVTSQGEGSVSGGGVGLKIGGQRTLSAIPLTEASLISEIKTLSDRLGKSGYRIIIGIDEMDKLEAGRSTEDFLNSIKQLFAISSCSFLVSVSSSAWARFVQRGVNIRDALDSSLDAIESIGALDFLETRSLILHRREAMSDSEILFCYVLAGGFPREVMRCAQSLARRNRDAEGGFRTLDVLAGQVLNTELDRLIEASRSAVSGWEFHDRDRMFRKLDDIAAGWKKVTSVPASPDAANSAGRSVHESINHQAKNESEVIILRLQLMVQFFGVVRQLFCTNEKVRAGAAASRAELPVAPASSSGSTEGSPSGGEPDTTTSPSTESVTANSWRSDILEICDTLAEIRRLVESDPTAALQELSKAGRQLSKEAKRKPARIASP